MIESTLDQIADCGSLRVLSSGLVIIRRRKHEWINGLENLPPDRLKTRTSKEYGSKFYPAWTLERLVVWIAKEVEAAGWNRQNSHAARLSLRLDDPVGLANGIVVHTFEIVSDGHYVHAYPVKDSL